MPHVVKQAVWTCHPSSSYFLLSHRLLLYIQLSCVLISPFLYYFGICSIGRDQHRRKLIQTQRTMGIYLQMFSGWCHYRVEVCPKREDQTVGNFFEPLPLLFPSTSQSHVCFYSKWLLLLYCLGIAQLEEMGNAQLHMCSLRRW